MHFNFLKKVKRLITNFFFYGKYYSLVGILIKVHGKFQGILRKRRFKHIYGKTSMTTLTTFVDYDLQKSYTKYGVFSIKVFLFYGY
jgi:ribosomal protein S3